MRPPRETYIRTSRKPSASSGEISVGLEYRGGDNVGGIQDRIYLLLCFDAPSDPDSHGVADRTAQRLAAEWPDRAYFVEVWSGDDARGWVQIFQPFGVPRNWSTEHENDCPAYRRPDMDNRTVLNECTCPMGDL